MPSLVVYKNREHFKTFETDLGKLSGTSVGSKLDGK
jgi:hypothetical protein